MKRFVKAINRYFINLLLAIFYLTVLGLSYVLLTLAKRRKRNSISSKSFWENADTKESSIDYFLSSY